MFCRSTGVRKQIIVALCVYLGQLVVGYNLGWTAPVIPKLQDPASSPLSVQITEAQKSIVGSLLYLGALAGPYLTGYLSNVKGRKACLLIGGVTSCIAYIVLATARTITVIYIGRFLAGFGGGIITVTSLVYLGEIASTNIRGIFLTGIGIFNTSGSVVSFSVGPFVPYPATAYVGACLALAYSIAIVFVPETPTFYAITNQQDAVVKVLEGFGRTSDIDLVFSSRKEFVETNNSKDWNELFFLKCNRRSLIITVILNVAQHGCGVLAVTFFATTIFQLAGSSVEPRLATIIIGLTQMFGAFLTPIFVERSGRRVLLLISTAMCCLSMLVLGTYFYLDQVNYWAAYNLKWLPLACLIVFYVSYDSGLGIIPNALLGEMFHPNARTKGCAVAVTISWLTGFLITTAFGSLVTVVGGHVGFWFFSGVCAFTFMYTLFFVPETKGRSLTEIQDMLSK